MDHSVIAYSSGQKEAYTNDVLPMEKRLSNGVKADWVFCVFSSILFAIGGIVAGYYLLPTLLGLFTGLLGGSFAGLVVLLVYYWLRSLKVAKTKRTIITKTETFEQAYKDAYSIPENVTECEIVGSNFLPKEYYVPSIAFAREDGSISVVSKDYRLERNELRYSKNSVIAYALLGDSAVLVQSEEGYVLLSFAAKQLFLDSDLPLFECDMNLLVCLNQKVLSIREMRKDAVLAVDTFENASWQDAESKLSHFVLKGATNE